MRVDGDQLIPDIKSKDTISVQDIDATDAIHRRLDSSSDFWYNYFICNQYTSFQ